MSNWVDAAAREIWNELNGTHSYIFVSTMQAIIEKHCPFKKNVAYMPVPRCDTCKHWQSHREITRGQLNTNFGWCELIGGREQFRGDFGCTKWEKKE